MVLYTLSIKQGHAKRAGHVQQHTLLHVGTPLMSFSMGEVSARGPFFTCSTSAASLSFQLLFCPSRAPGTSPERWSALHKELLLSAFTFMNASCTRRSPEDTSWPKA